MKYARWLAAWALFWVGDAASRIINLYPDGDKEPASLRGLMAVYQFCMTGSNRIQGDAPGPWEQQRKARTKEQP